jgi:hypothetical protein
MYKHSILIYNSSIMKKIGFLDLRPDVFDDVTDPQHQLVLDGGNPGVVVQLQDRAGTQEILEKKVK